MLPITYRSTVGFLASLNVRVVKADLREKGFVPSFLLDFRASFPS